MGSDGAAQGIPLQARQPPAACGRVSHAAVGLAHSARATTPAIMTYGAQQPGFPETVGTGRKPSQARESGSSRCVMSFGDAEKPGIVCVLGTRVVGVRSPRHLLGPDVGWLLQNAAVNFYFCKRKKKRRSNLRAA